MNKKYNNGNNLVIIIIVVVILILLGVIGFLLWNNLNSNKSDSKQESNTTSQQSAEEQKINEVLGTTTTKKVDDAFGVGLSFQVPEGWDVSSNKEGVWPIDATKGSSSETIAVISPDKNIAVIYNLIANGGMGGVCLAEELPTYKIAFFQKQEVPGFKNATFVEAISKDGDKLSSWDARLYNTSKVSTVAVGSHPCDLALNGVITLNEDKKVDLYSAQIIINDRELQDYKGNPTNTNLTQADIEQSFKAEDYIKAKNILLSTKLN